MNIKAISAKRMSVRLGLLQQHEMDMAKVKKIEAHLKSGGKIPPVVLVIIGDKALPLDGHHRMLASINLGIAVDAWTITSRQFDRLCTLTSDVEQYVLCGGIPAMKVAESWCNLQA